MSASGTFYDTELWDAFCELVRKASPPSPEPTEDDEAFARIDRLLAERAGRSGQLILLLAFYVSQPMHRLLEDHFGDAGYRAAQVLVAWPVVQEASPVMQTATNLVACIEPDISRQQVAELLVVIEHGWRHHSERYIQLLNCLVWLVAALREGTVRIGPALETTS
jgi:hypothetical protein